MSQTQRSIKSQLNPDSIMHPRGAHVLGTGVGAAVGGVAGAIAAGAVMGTVAGPIGTAAGAAVGAVVGGLAGKHVAEDVNPAIEEVYWRETYAARPYALNKSYDDYGPAYRYGRESYGRHKGRRFDDVEKDLERDWEGAKGKSRLKWHHAKHAVRDAWDRLAATHEKP
jgi:hypothetical protein